MRALNLKVHPLANEVYLETTMYVWVAALCLVLSGSHQTRASAATLAGEHIVGLPGATQSVDFVIHLPLRNSAGLDQLISLQSDKGSPLYHHFLTPAQFRASYGPAAQTIAQVSALLDASHLSITKVETQLLYVRGTVTDVERAFSTKLAVTRSTTGMLGLRAVTPPVLPKELTALGATVHGLMKTMDVHPNFARTGALPANRYSPVGPYWFDDLKQAYEYPSYRTANGKGVTIATVGYSDFSDADAALYFGHELLGSKKTDLAPAPKLVHKTFPGSLKFNTADGNSFEANLDVQQSGGSAPGATIVGIAVPATAGEGFLLGYSYIDEAGTIDIVSTSYGDCELRFTAAYNNGQDFTGILRAYHDLFRQGNSEGITFVFSSGDSAGLACPQAGYFLKGPGLKFKDVPGVLYWADDPSVTGVGGTNLVTSYIIGSLQSTYVRENAYPDREFPSDPYGTGNTIVNPLWGSGGGQSALWPKPAYQRLVDTHTKNRAVPDVAMHMGGCPYDAIQPCAPDRSQDIEAFGGYCCYSNIGTGASAPEFAGLLAIKEQGQGNVRLGNENYDLYELAKNNKAFPQYPFFHQGIPGYNGVVSVAAGQEGYNVITGVGTPYGKNFSFLPYAPRAGDPQTPSNP